MSCRLGSEVQYGAISFAGSAFRLRLARVKMGCLMLLIGDAKTL